MPGYVTGSEQTAEFGQGRPETGARGLAMRNRRRRAVTWNHFCRRPRNPPATREARGGRPGRPWRACWTPASRSLSWVPGPSKWDGEGIPGEVPADPSRLRAVMRLTFSQACAQRWALPDAFRSASAGHNRGQFSSWGLFLVPAWEENSAVVLTNPGFYPVLQWKVGGRGMRLCCAPSAPGAPPVLPIPIGPPHRPPAPASSVCPTADAGFPAWGMTARLKISPGAVSEIAEGGYPSPWLSAGHT